MKTQIIDNALVFTEDTANGTNKASVIAPVSLTSDLEFRFPTTGGTIATEAHVNTQILAYGGSRWAYKAAATTRTATTTLTADPDLTLTVLADSLYKVEGVLDITTPAAADMDILLAVPSGAVFSAVYSTPTGLVSWDGSEATLADPDGALTFNGILSVSSTAGSATIQWAQTTSDAGDTVMESGSYMLLTKLD